MKKVYCFIFGIVAYISLIPILESITEVICSNLEILKGIATKKVLKINKEINDLQSELEPIDTNCIGFEIPSEEYYEDDEEWEDDKLKNKIGF